MPVQLEEPFKVPGLGVEAAVRILVNGGYVVQGGRFHALPEFVRHGVAAEERGGRNQAAHPGRMLHGQGEGVWPPALKPSTSTESNCSWSKTARTAAGDEEKGRLVGGRVTMDLVVHAQVAVGRVSVGESHTAS